MSSLFDILVIVILAFEIFLGFLDGFRVRFLRMLGLLLAIVLASTFCFPLYSATESLIGIHSNKVVLLCWIAIFILIAGIAFFLVRRVEHAQDKQQGGGFLSPTSHITGALIGGLHGILLVLVLTWSYSMLRINFSPMAPSHKNSKLGKYISRANEAAAFMALYPKIKSEPAARRAAWLIGHPDATLEFLKDLNGRTTFIMLVQSDPFWRLVLAGDEDAIYASPFFQDFLYDKTAMRALAPLALVTRNYELVESRKALAADLARLGRNFSKIQYEDPVAALVESLINDNDLSPTQRPRLRRDTRFLQILNHVINEAAAEHE